MRKDNVIAALSDLAMNCNDQSRPVLVECARRASTCSSLDAVPAAVDDVLAVYGNRVTVTTLRKLAEIMDRI